MRLISQITPHPGHSLAAHNVVGVDEPINAWNRGHVSAHYNHGLRGDTPNHATHLAHLTQVHDDGRNANHVVLLLLELASKVFERGKVQHRAGR